MSNKTKIWLILATIFVVFGAGIFGFAMSKYNWDFTKLSTVKYETKTYELNEKFTDVVIDSSISDIKFISSEDNTCKVVCDEIEKVKHDVYVSDNKLTININDERKWYDYINIVSISPKITIYLPNNNLESFNLYGKTGDVYIENLSIKALNISITTGDIMLQNIKSDDLFIKGSTGDINMNNVIITNTIAIEIETGDIELDDTLCNKLDIKTNTGDTKLTNVLVSNDFTLDSITGDLLLDGFDALNMDIKINTGDINGTILTSKIFDVETRTGRVRVPESSYGGKCKIRTGTGDINLSYKN